MTVRTEQRWSAETAGLVAGAWHRGVGCKHPDTCPNAVRPTAAERAAGEVVLDALRDAGWLLPEGGETREQWAILSDDGGETRGIEYCDDEARADWKLSTFYRPGRAHKARQAVTEWPDGRAYFGPWEPVHVDA